MTDNSQPGARTSNECVCGHTKAAHYSETACSFENCDCVMFEEPKAMIDPTCDCSVDQQDRCAARAEPFHNPSTFRCKARSAPVASGQTIQTILIARLGTIRNIAEGGLSERSLPEIARLAKEALQIAGSHETSELQRALHVIDEAGKLSDWINRARPVVTDLMAAYERRIRTDCTPEQIAKEPWRCMEYIGAENLLRDQPIAVVELTAQKASEPHKRVWTGPGHLEETGYIDPTPSSEGEDRG